MRATEEIIEELKQKVKENKVKDPQACRQLLIDTIREKMDLGENAYEFDIRKSIVMLIGVNGVGKTTSGGMLAGHLKAMDKKVVMAAADTFRRSQRPNGAREDALYPLPGIGAGPDGGRSL